MFWKYDDEEKEVVPRGQAILTPSEYAKRAREAGHASFVHGLDEEVQERIFDELKAHQDEDSFSSSNEDGSEERFINRVEVFKKEEKPVVKEPETKPIVKQEEPKVEAKKPVNVSKDDLKEGIFRNEYFGQTNNGTNTQSAETLCGVFKSSSGWGNGKYYALMNGVERGTIVKIMVNGRAVYAKVLDAVPNVKENAGLNVLISNAAAAKLEIKEQKFNVGVMYESKAPIP